MKLFIWFRETGDRSWEEITVLANDRNEAERLALELRCSAIELLKTEPKIVDKPTAIYDCY